MGWVVWTGGDEGKGDSRRHSVRIGVYKGIESAVEAVRDKRYILVIMRFYGPRQVVVWNIASVRLTGQGHPRFSMDYLSNASFRLSFTYLTGRS
jgi:hypothetical protein